LVVIEDACQAHGASINGKKMGSYGTGCFSFYPTKNITTGEGGMITTNYEGVADKARNLRAHGQAGYGRCDFLGYNFRMTELQAVIGLVQLESIEEWTANRIDNAKYLTRRLEDNVITPQVKEDFVHVFHQYTIRVKKNRDQFVKMLNEVGIGARIYYPVLVYDQSFYRQMGYNDYLPIAEKAIDQVVSLPVHPSLTEDELEKIVIEVRNLRNIVNE